MVLATELVDWRRFTSPRQLMSYFGLVPREHSSGERERRGAITTAGNSHVRHGLVQAAWSDRHVPKVGVGLQARQQGQSPRVIAHLEGAASPLQTLPPAPREAAAADRRGRRRAGARGVPLECHAGPGSPSATDHVITRGTRGGGQHRHDSGGRSSTLSGQRPWGKAKARIPDPRTSQLPTDPISCRAGFARS